MTAWRLTGALLALGILAGCQEEEVSGVPIDTAAAERGAALMPGCTGCHAIEVAENRIGPHLVNVYGRQVAAVAEFAYSEALAAEDFVWEEDRLVAFLLNPTETYPGTMMAYDGLSPQEAADISEYLRSLSDTPG